MVTTDAVEVLERGTSSRVRLRVKPGARRTCPVGAHGGALKIQVQAPPERGRANQAVVQLVAELIGVEPRRVTLVSGAGSQDKLVEIEGVEPPVVVAALTRRGVPARQQGQRPAPDTSGAP